MHNTSLLAACRIMAGLVFLSSAIFKFMAIDAFELYIYSLDWFPLLLCFYLARLLIVFEFTLGLGLLSFAYRRYVNIACYCVLGLFSIFLIYLVSIGYDGNCHCMGEVVDLPPLPSLLKNVVIAFLVALSANVKPYHIPQVGKLLTGLAVVTLLAIFIASPPDGIRSSKPAVVHTDYTQRFADTDSLFQAEYAQKPKVLVCMFSTGCRICKLSAKKLQLMVNNHNLPENKFLFLFHGDEESRLSFLSKAEVSGNFPYQKLEPEVFGQMVGMVPAFLLFEYGKLTDTYTYRTLTEDVIKQLEY